MDDPVENDIEKPEEDTDKIMLFNGCCKEKAGDAFGE